MTDNDYESGLRDGRIKALEEMINHHDNRISNIESSVKLLEKVAYSVLGAVSIITIIPEIKLLLS